MGLPRWLKKDLDDVWANASRNTLLIVGMRSGMRLVQSDVYKKVLNIAADKGLSEEQQIRALVQWTWRNFAVPRDKSTDALERVKAELYTGLELRSGENEAVFRVVEIPYYFLDSLEGENTKMEERDREFLVLRERIRGFRERVYSSRNFPSKLKEIIFQRDNHTCQACLRDRVELQRTGLHLECDHIVAWEDGGQTTYHNAQTICSLCNKAKHHAKSYLGLVARLKGARPLNRANG